MARKHADPAICAIPADVLEALLVRCAERLSPEDHALATRLVTAFLILSHLVREGRATLRRLRRLFGLLKSEKKSKVFPSNPETGTAGNGSSDPEGNAASDCGQPNSPPGDAAPLDAKPKQPPKGHGRLGVGAYNVEPTPVGHESLEPGGECPRQHCSGSLYDLKLPEQILRIFGQAPLFAKAWACQRLRCSRCQTVFTAKHPPEACGPKFSESAAAVMAAMHFWFGTPHYRLERAQEALGTPIPDATQWEVLHARALEIHPAYEHLLHLGAQASLLHADDTHMPVLGLMGKRREKLVEQDKLPRPDRTGLFTTGIVAMVAQGPLALFVTGRRHTGENVAALLERRAKELPPPLFMSDALGHNVPKGHPVVECNCLAHGRRGIVDQAESFPAECRYVLDRIGEVYAVEHVCREENLSPKERLWMHQLVSAPVMKKLRVWMTKQLKDKRIEPSSGIGRAFNYMLERWDKLTVFLRIPGAPIDNNAAERILKLAIVHRKNSLFYRSERGAAVGDIYQTLIHTAVIHGENPIDYLVALMSNVRAVAAAPADWMPWNFRVALARVAAGQAASAAAEAPVAKAATADPSATPPITPPAPSTSIPTPPIADPPVTTPSASIPAAESSVPQTPGKRASRSASRSAKPPLIPPPAFALFTLLWLLVPFIGRVQPLAAAPLPSFKAAATVGLASPHAIDPALPGMPAVTWPRPSPAAPGFHPRPPP